MRGPRFEQRKRQRVNTILNIAITVVVVLILFFAAQLFIGSDDTEEVVLMDEDDVESTEEEEIEAEREEAVVKDTITTIEKENSSIYKKKKDDQNRSEENEENEEETDSEFVEIVEGELIPESEWEPIGTTQEVWVHDFDESGQDWQEMTMALQYATGLGDNMIVWRLENGGAVTRARGVVSAPDEQDKPFEVYIEWIEGEGWKPVERNQLSSNPYKG